MSIQLSATGIMVLFIVLGFIFMLGAFVTLAISLFGSFWDIDHDS